MTKSAAQSCEDRLHLLLGRLVHAFARFDFSMGLQLKWLGPYRGVDVESLLQPKQPFQNRLTALKPLVIDTYGHQSKEIRQHFEVWFALAQESKVLRNDYVHGRWHFDPDWRSDGDTVKFSPLSWDMDPETQPATINVSLSAFQTEVEAVERLFLAYWELEEQHRHQARWSAAWEAEQQMAPRSQAGISKRPK